MVRLDLNQVPFALKKRHYYLFHALVRLFGRTVCFDDLDSFGFSTRQFKIGVTHAHMEIGSLSVKPIAFVFAV